MGRMGKPRGGRRNGAARTGDSISLPSATAGESKASSHEAPLEQNSDPQLLAFPSRGGADGWPSPSRCRTLPLQAPPSLLATMRRATSNSRGRSAQRCASNTRCTTRSALAALQPPGTPALNRPHCQQKKPSGVLHSPELIAQHSWATAKQRTTSRERGATGSIPSTHHGHCLGSTTLNKSLDFSDWNAKASANSQGALLSALRIHNYSRAHKVIPERGVWLQQVQTVRQQTS